MSTTHRFWRRLTIPFMGWYDPETERERDRQTEAIRQRSIAARIALERLDDCADGGIRSAYRAYGDHFR